jgi:Major Facilitator Superfamily.
MYTNYAVEMVGVTGEQTGIIHAMREVPGLLSIGVILLLLVLKEHTLLTLSVICTGIFTLITGFFPSFRGVLLTAMCMSFGYHYYEACTQSLALQYFNTRETPLVMGKLRAATAAGSLFIGILIFFLSSFLPYTVLFAVAGIIAMAGGIWGLSQKPASSSVPVQRKKMIVRKKYWLFYTLTLLSGARRHIFSTFSIFLLVSRFGFSVREMLLLFILNNAINWFLNPLIGKAINSVGERKLLTLKYIVLACIFTTYCMTDSRMLVAGLYVCEQLFTNFSMAIRTFFQKIGDPKDIAPSIAVGQTINHISAVILPIAGGMLWMIDYRIPFVMGIVIALTALVMTQFIRYPKPQTPVSPVPVTPTTDVDENID